MNQTIPIEDWPRRLERVLAEHCRVFRRATVLRETDSTQDAARRMGASVGDVIVAWRQTAGRGRLGRPWRDTQQHGLAVTLVVDRAPSERLALAAAIGTARAIESVANRAVRLKWPNDVLLEGRKLAGVLIEQIDGVALIGVGVNVAQTEFDADLAPCAVSLAQGGAHVDRLELLERLLPEIGQALSLVDGALIDEFMRRDVLTGSIASFQNNGHVITGRVVRLDPMRGLLVELASGEQRWLPAAITSVVK